MNNFNVTRWVNGAKPSHGILPYCWKCLAAHEEITPTVSENTVTCERKSKCCFPFDNTRPQYTHFAMKLCLVAVNNHPSYFKVPTFWISPSLNSVQPNELSEIAVSTVTSPLLVWLNTSLPPPCCSPCTHKPQSLKAPHQPEAASRAHHHVAPSSLCPIQTLDSHFEATAPLAEGSLKWRQEDISA